MEARKETPLEKTTRIRLEQPKKTREEQIKEAMEGPQKLEDYEEQMVQQDPYVWRNWSNPKHRVARSRAIRLKCLDCCCGNSQEVRLCRTITCALWPYRMGRENRIFPEWPEEGEE